MKKQERTSFVFHINDPEQYEDMTKEELGELLYSLIQFATTGEEEIASSDRFVKAAFRSQVSAIKSDWEKYDKTCERNRLNGAKGGRPKKTEDHQTDNYATEQNPQKPSGFSEEPKKADMELDKELELDKDSLKKERERKDKKKSSSFLPFPCEIDGVSEIVVQMVNKYISEKRYSWITETAVNELYQDFADGRYSGVNISGWRDAIDLLERKCKVESRLKARAQYPLEDEYAAVLL